MNIASFLVKAGDVVSIREHAKGQNRVRAAIALSEQRPSCDWITVDAGTFKGTFNNHPSMNDLPTDFNVDSVVELYSK